MTDQRVDLNPNQLLGLCQVLKVSSEQPDDSQDARLLSKVGSGGENPSPTEQNARVLSKIGPGENPPEPDQAARLLSKVSNGEQPPTDG